MCVSSCQFGAVKCGEKKKVLIRSVDVQNVNKLQSMNNMTVLEHPKQIETVVEKF
jgi:flavoprotein